MSNRLGKGLDALFKDNLNFSEEPQSNEVIVEIEINLLKENPYQPRKKFDEEKIDELAQSIKEHGVFQPIIVKKSEASYYIVAGERRYRACKKLGLQTIPAIVRDVTDQTMAEVALLENLQRENLTHIEEANAYKMILDKYEFTQQEVAERVGKSRSHVANTLRLLNLPQEIQQLVNDQKIEFGHAKILAGINDADLIKTISEKIINEGLTVRALEQIIKAHEEQPMKQAPKKEEKDVHIINLEEQIMNKLGTKTRINIGEKGGKLVIDFYNTADLNRILNLLDLLDKPL